jgi:hypothetical protein
MGRDFPNLWLSESDATRLYQLYLCRLQMYGMHPQVIEACQHIRRHAARNPGPTAILFTYSIEIDSLCELKQYEAAWKRLRSQEKTARGERLDLRRHKWSKGDGFELEFSYAPLLYFRGQYRRGCKLLETSLGFWFGEKKVRSFDLLWGVVNGDEEPQHRCRVTLSHFYRRLGKSLNEWQYWDQFVNGLHPRFFPLAGMKRAELLAEPERLQPFVDALTRLRDERTPSGIGGSQSDLVESAAKVRKRQSAMQRKLNAFSERIKPETERTDRRLKQLFPELSTMSPR